MNNAKEGINSPNKKKKKQEKELEKISDELSKRLMKMGGKKGKTRVFSIRINPLIIVATIIIGAFVLYGVLARSSYGFEETTVDRVVKGLKNNEFSQITLQNDGKVIVSGKSFLIAKDDKDIDLPDSDKVKYSTQLEEKSLNDFLEEISSQDFLTKLKAFFNGKNTSISEIVIGDDFIVGLRGIGEKDVIVRNVDEEEFEEIVQQKDIDLTTLKITKKPLRIFGVSSSESSIVDMINSYQVERVLNLEGTLIAQIDSNYISRSYIDWSPRIESFPETIQKEGISLSSENFEIVPVDVPAPVTLNDILTVLTLVGLVILGIILYRGAQSSGMGLMQFGQSKARIFFGMKPDVTFKDVAGIDEAREELNEVVDFLKNPKKYRDLGARIPKGILMVGPPGTGKTLLARAIAGEAGVPFFHTSGSEFEEMLVGAGASRVRDLFSKAKKAAPSLVFIDEIDAVARKRGTRIQSGNTEQTLNQILVEMDGFEKNTNVIVLAATNRPDVLDPAILRPGRFDRQVVIEVPDKDGRKAIMEIHGKNKPFGSDVDLEKIAKRTVGFTGADLENVLNESAIIAAKANKKEINMEDIEEAVSKVVLGPAKKSRKRTEDELKLVAYHEAGHALVAKFTPKATPVDKISITSRGGSGGATMFLPEKDEYIMSKAKLLADVTVSLGGRAAEEVALDDISTGASNDIQKATEVVRRMVQKFGMSEKLGMVQYGQSLDSEYLGYAYGDNKDFSEKTAEMIDVEVRELIQHAYEKAKSIIRENRGKLDELAVLLLDKEVVDKEEFERLFV